MIGELPAPSESTYTFLGWYTEDGKYYQGGHGENTSKETKEDSGRLFRRLRGE